MSFRRALLVASLLALIAACGKFGQKGGDRLLFDYSPESIGCLNDVGPRVQRFVNGDISEAEWGATCDCAIDSLGQFKKFVHGSGPDGTFTQTDISGFLANFLLTSYPRNSKLVSSGFDLKAALVGGSRDYATPEDIDVLIKVLKSIKAETTRLIPHLKRRSNHPTREELLELSDSVALAGAAIANSLGSGTHALFPWDSLNTLAQELANVSRQPLPDRFIDWISAGKRLIFSGDPGGISGQEIPKVVELAASYLGPLIGILSVQTASLSGPNPKAELYLKLAQKARPAIEKTLEIHRGALPLVDVDRLLESFPKSWLDTDLEILEKTMRPFVSTLLRSDTPNALDGSSVQILYATGEDWVESQKIIDQVYGARTLMAPDEFVRAANRLGPSDPATMKRVARLTFLAQYFKPMLEQGDYQVRFVKLTQLSHTDISQLLWIRIAVEEIMKSYSSAPSRDKVDKDDFKRFIDDYEDFGFILHLLDNADKTAYLRRFRESNIFTFSGNGDDFMDMNEATYYIVYFYSGKVLSFKLLDALKARCESQGLDPLLFTWVKASCFRQEFYGNYRKWWDHFPDLIRFYDSLTASQQQDFQRSLEQGSRKFGYSESAFASYDSDAVTGLIHFMEGMYVRYDRNGDQILDLNELMIAYPVFKGTIASIADIDPDDNSTLEAVFTYIVKYREPPKKDILGLIKFLLWKLQRSSWDVKADRGAIYEVMAQLATPATR